MNLVKTLFNKKLNAKIDEFNYLANTTSGNDELKKEMYESEQKYFYAVDLKRSILISNSMMLLSIGLMTYSTIFHSDLALAYGLIMVAMGCTLYAVDMRDVTSQFKERDYDVISQKLDTDIINFQTSLNKNIDKLKKKQYLEQEPEF